MKYVQLGASPLKVSRICLGTMTWGVQNSQEDANQQLDYALAQGINFVDTAEMYAIPPKKETYGKTETYIGNWIKANPDKRQDMILASKIAGPGLSYIREGKPITSQAVIAAVEASLKRLQTDYIDLYQLHWPNYPTPHFGKHWPNQVNYREFDAEAQRNSMLDILQGLDACIKAGKIRYCGLSDDSPWGLNQYLQLSKEHNLPRMVSVQNEFSLLHHKDWPYLMENCIHEEVAYLPWSPLATGLLTGKYLNGARPAGTRFTFMQRHGLFRDTSIANEAVSAFVELAKKHGISPATLALGWVDQVQGVTSTIIGATRMSQLEENIAAFTAPLSADVIHDIEQILTRYPAPF
ncbi:aldo/keto reductase [Thalassomonas viridans]|uniref:Aldo/keto reductase n=1 Tax=Thalassomonas viridans TaxID=137584 RepID=A0AAF0CD58_9GAMM|nr:aldo/keto reductase [Thalassomonas viridans]WDE08878.1 aldo/keto reductase [Thalassomonas viridans]